MAVSAMVKACTACGVEKELDQFHIHNTGKYGRNPRCRDCINGRSRDRYASNIEDHRHRSKARNMKHKYGLEPDEYLAKVRNAVCEICGSDKPGRAGQEFMCVDHNHETGTVRGTLCIGCNLAIGYLKEDVDLLLAALTYLTKYKEM